MLFHSFQKYDDCFSQNNICWVIQYLTWQFELVCWLQIPSFLPGKLGAAQGHPGDYWVPAKNSTITSNVA
jgi:hypothetical protein